jgi:hypothetical protein
MPLGILSTATAKQTFARWVYKKVNFRWVFFKARPQRRWQHLFTSSGDGRFATNARYNRASLAVTHAPQLKYITVYLEPYFKYCLFTTVFKTIGNIVRISQKNSYGFWDNQWFGRNQIYLKLKLGALQFMRGIKNLNLNFFLNFFWISNEKTSIKKPQKFQIKINF